MKLTAGLLALSGGALAAPRSAGTLADRLHARSGLTHQSKPLTYLGGGGTSGDDSNARLAADTNVAYSNNWAGAVREQPPAEGPYTAVSATFTVPKPTSVGGNQVEAGSAWVGIDGDTYTNAILQAGVDFYSNNGQPYNTAWYEWFPDGAYNFDEVQVNTGDVIVARVESLSPSQGVAVIENRSNGQKATKTMYAPQPTATLAGQNADWIVEDFQSGEKMVALADFSTVEFWGAGAEAGGKRFGVADATVIELKQEDKVLTKVEVKGDSELTVNYVKG